MAMGCDKRLGDIDLEFLDKVADELIISGVGANDIWGRGFKMALQEIRDTRKLLNTPLIDDFMEAVKREAAHQVERWGTDHDAGKTHSDWITLIVYLMGKAAAAYYSRDPNKLKHHVITTAAALFNWFRALTGEDTRMRPGIAP